MPTRIVFVSPGVTRGILTQMFVEDPNQVFEALRTAYTPSWARTGE
jgi:hypothetical protein